VSIAAAALLCYLLYTAVRARRFELAVMRALGLSNRGVRWSVAAQATATAVVPLIVAIPAGIVVGRWAWLSSARHLDVVAVSVTPWSALVLLVGSAIVIANLAVIVPGWALAKRSPSGDLRAG
jgi:ABC-type antimicrobial peptide transport system permease subunit